MGEHFLSEDPIAADTNLYRYAGNDPVNYVDPTGLSSQHAFAGLPAFNNNSRPWNTPLVTAPPSTGLFNNGGSSLIGRSSTPSLGTFNSYGSLSTSIYTPPISTPSLSSFNSYTVSAGILNGTQRAGDIAAKFAVPPAPSLNDVHTNYFRQYANDANFRRSIDAQYDQQSVGTLGSIVNTAMAIPYAPMTMPWASAIDAHTVYQNTAHMGLGSRIYTTAGFYGADLIGLRGISDAFSQHDAVHAHLQTAGERWMDGIGGSVQLGGLGWGLHAGIYGAAPMPAGPARSFYEPSDVGIDLSTYTPVGPAKSFYRPSDVGIEVELPGWRVMSHGDMPSPRPAGFQSHHGVNSVWMDANFNNYSMDNAPAILMPNVPNHNATRGIFNRMRSEIAARQGVSPRSIDWSDVPAGTAWRLSEEQLRAAQTPQAIRIEYFRQFNAYINPNND